MKDYYKFEYDLNETLGFLSLCFSCSYNSKNKILTIWNDGKKYSYFVFCPDFFVTCLKRVWK